MQRWSLGGLTLLLLLICLIAVNVVAYHVPLRYDATEEKLYTISEGSRQILNELEDPVRVKFYFTSHNEELPPTFKGYAQRVQELLEEYAKISGGKLQLEVFDPRPDTEEEEWAQKYGIEKVPLPSGANVYFGAVFLQLDEEMSIPFFDPRRQEFLEYDISQAIYRVGNVARPKIGVLTGLPLEGLPPQMGMGRGGGEPWVLWSELQKTNDVEMLPLSGAPIADDIDLVLALHPKDYSDAQLYALDQYVLRGGKLLVALDANARADALSGGAQSMNFTSNLPRLLEAWGVEYNGGLVVGDLQLGTPVNSAQGVLRFPLWLSLGPEQLDREHPVTSQLESLLLAEAGFVSPADNATSEFLPLVQTTSLSGTVESFALRFGSPEQIARDLATDDTTRTLLAQVSGVFPSAFPEGAPADFEATSAHLSQAAGRRTVLLVSDVDFISDQFSVQKLNFLGTSIVQPTNDNLNLMLNAVEFLSGNEALMEIRSRGTFQRPFTRVLALQQEAQVRYQAEEAQLQASLEDIQAQLDSLLQGAQQQGAQEVILPQEVQVQVAQFREQERQTRRELREVRKILRQDIERLGNQLLLVNLLGVPAVVGLAGFFFYRGRTRRR
jgi:ABC-type uncharacterized transport system involved in gliding motility auxiliary subunit